MLKIKNKHWKKQFKKHINCLFRIDEILSHSPGTLVRYEGALDALYMLGVSIDKEKYQYRNGFDNFLKDLGIIPPTGTTTWHLYRSI